MKLTIHTEKIIRTKHDWKSASTNFAHMNGVSWLGWCKNCEEEAISGSASKTCQYYRTKYKTSFDGENVSVSSQKSIDDAVDLCIKDMVRTACQLTRKNIEIPNRHFQGSTSIASRAFSYLKNNNILNVVDGNIVIDLNKTKYNKIKNEYRSTN